MKIELNFQFLQKHWVQGITTQRFWSSAQFLLRGQREKKESGKENEQENKQLEEKGVGGNGRRGVGGEYLHTKIIHKDIGTWNVKKKKN